MDAPFLGQIFMFGFSFVPDKHAACNGQLFPIAQNTALFSLLGTTYGGNGQTTFALPDLRGRVPIGVGQGPGLSAYDLGEETGSETVTLSGSELASHGHALDVAAIQGTLRGRNSAGNQRDAAGNVPAMESAGVTAPYSDATPLTSSMAAGAVALNGTLAVAPAGGSQPHDNMQPYLALTYCIALQGVFPPQQ